MLFLPPMGTRERTGVGAPLPVRPEGLRVAELPVGGDTAYVFSYPVAAKEDSLTPAEREVARLLMSGLSNAAIAASRGTSTRTISKQVDAIYRKLGVHSRVELALRDRDRDR